eukprot:UN25285
MPASTFGSSWNNNSNFDNGWNTSGLFGGNSNNSWADNHNNNWGSGATSFNNKWDNNGFSFGSSNNNNSGFSFGSSSGFAPAPPPTGTFGGFGSTVAYSFGEKKKEQDKKVKKQDKEDKDEDFFHLNINIVGNPADIFKIHVHPTDKIHMVKTIVCRFIKNVVSSSVNLIFAGKVIHNQNKSLEDLNIQPNNTMYVYFNSQWMSTQHYCFVVLNNESVVRMILQDHQFSVTSLKTQYCFIYQKCIILPERMTWIYWWKLEIKLLLKLIQKF